MTDRGEDAEPSAGADLTGGPGAERLGPALPLAPRVLLVLSGAVAIWMAGNVDVARMAWGGAGGVLLCLAVFAAWQTFQDAARLAQAGAPQPVGTARALDTVSTAFQALLLWAALSMAVGYYLTPQEWYHAYQYALAFALVALAFGVVRARLIAPVMAGGPAPARWHTILLVLTVAQGIAFAAALAHLNGADKLPGTRADWLANVLFATVSAGGLLASLAGIAALITGSRGATGGVDRSRT